MKALFNTLLVAFALTAASFNTVQADPTKPKKAAAFQTGIHTTAEGKLQVAVQKETTSAVMVRLLDEKGNAVFSQQISKRQDAVRLRLDVSNLPDGWPSTKPVINNASKKPNHIGSAFCCLF